jgi:hypothetical protein
LHAKLLARARADLELFRSKLMRAIEAADDADIVRYATAFGVYLDRLYVHILREREVWGLTESGAPEVRIVRRGWIVVGSNGSSAMAAATAMAAIECGLEGECTPHVRHVLHICTWRLERWRCPTGKA